MMVKELEGILESDSKSFTCAIHKLEKRKTNY